MEGKNYNSNSFIIREAETIIQNYVEERKMSDIENYYHLKEKYDRLKILTVAISIVSSIGILFYTIF